MAKIYGLQRFAGAIPGIPGNFSGEAQNASQILLSWDAASDAVNYQVYRNGIPIGTTTILSYLDSGRTPSTSYSYQVQAISGDSVSSSLTTAIQVSTLPNGLPEWDFPNQSLTEGVAFFLDLHSVCAEPDNQTLTFSLFSGALPAGVIFNSTLGAINGTPTAVSAGTYPVTFRAFDGFANVNVAVTFTVIESDVTAPTVPTGLTFIDGSSTTIAIAWTASTDASGISRYDIHRSTTQNGTYSLRGSSATTAFTDSGLSANTTFWYKVRAVDASSNQNQSALSSAVSGATDASTPSLTVQQLQSLGFVVVTTFAGVKNDGTGDSTAGIQAALDNARPQRKPVFFPNQANGSRGVYIISDTLRCFTYQDFANTTTGDPYHNLYGSGAGGVRPVIKLAASAPKFDNAGTPRPMICQRLLHGTDSTAIGQPASLPDNPLQNPASWVGFAANVYRSDVFNIDFDTNQHAGAIGLYWPGAQFCFIGNVKVTATGSYCGIAGLPGTQAHSGLEVVGGQYNIVLNSLATNDGCAGVTLTNIKLSGATVAPIKNDTFVPCEIIGFDISRDTAGPIFKSEGNTAATGWGVMQFIDGKVSTPSGIAFDNTIMKTMYLRNVFVTGTAQLIKSGSNAIITGSGTWKLIREYCASDPTQGSGLPYAIGTTTFRTYSMLAAKSSTIQEPVIDIQSNVAAPAGDIATKHGYAFPVIDSDIFVDIRDFNAVAGPANAVTNDKNVYNGNETTTADSRLPIQNAIDAAEQAGHGRVVVPYGVYYVGSPGLNLHPNTKLFGINRKGSTLAIHGTWRPTTGSPFMITTDNNAISTAFLGFMQLTAPSKRGGGGSSTQADPMNRFSYLSWRLGKGSCTAALMIRSEFIDPDWLINAKTWYQFSANGGGKHFGICTESHWDSSNLDYRTIKGISTTQPLWFYNFNPECSKQPILKCLANAEMIGCQNFAFTGMKREGNMTAVKTVDCSNFALYGSGANRDGDDTPNMYVTGESNNFIATCHTIQSLHGGRTNVYTYRETVTVNGVAQPEQSVFWPEQLSIRKRGIFNDAGMF